MDKNKIISIFSQHTQNFDFDNLHIAQNFQHSLNVANYALEIANFLLLDDNQKTCAFLIGLLHEFGTFEAITSSAPTQKHKLTMKILFKENKIKSFTENISQINLIKKTLQIYGKLQTYKTDTNLNITNDKVNTLLNILKDADTLELFGRFKRQTINAPFNNSLTKKSFSKIVLNTFKQEKKIDFNDISSNLDLALFFVSLFFDLNYPISKNLALKINFQQGIIDSYKTFFSEIELAKLNKRVNSFTKLFYLKE